MDKKGQPKEIKLQDLQHFRTLRIFREYLAEAQNECELDRTFADSRRRLALGDYLGLMLFGLLNPVARTMRGLVQASNIEKVQADVCSRPVSLGSFSETQHLVNLDILEKMFARLSKEIREAESKSLDSKAGEVIDWLAHDGSLWSALPRMSWALYGGGRNGNAKAVKLHLSFLVGADCPAEASVVEGRVCERAELRKRLKKGGAYVADRYFGEDYGLLDELEKRECRYCIRILDSARVEVVEKLGITDADAQCGVLRQELVKLGHKKWQRGQLRLVYVRGVTGEILLLATNLGVDQMSARDIASLYKNRWSIEYFFRWVKCVLGCGHWMAESRKGVTIQIYLALIASLLLQLQLGRRPSKRVWELMQWHQMKLIGDDELAVLLREQLAREARKRSKNSQKKI